MEEVIRPSDNEVSDAIRTLIRAIGENPELEGLIETPDRIMRMWERDI